MRPHRWQPTRLPCPWDSPGKNTGVGCHFLLQCMKVKSECEVTQPCPTLSDPMDCSLPGSSIHGIFQARVLEWGAIPFSNLRSLEIEIPCPLKARLWYSGNLYIWSKIIKNTDSPVWTYLGSYTGFENFRKSTCTRPISILQLKDLFSKMRSTQPHGDPRMIGDQGLPCIWALGINSYPHNMYTFQEYVTICVNMCSKN